MILGSLTFQRHPAPLALDGVAELHRDLFRRLANAPPANHAQVFADYMSVHFCLEQPEDAGFVAQGKDKGRTRATYARVLRGWSFDADSREGAVLKGWVESRFGLLARHHRGPLGEPGGAAWRRYQQMRAQGLYGTHALEAQLDLVYTFCQHQLALHHPGVEHLTLYRGVNRLDEHETLARGEGGRRIVLLNNLNSFTASRERAGEFGDAVLETRTPLAKVLAHHGLLPGTLRGEDEYLVIGGVAEVVVAKG